MKHSEETSHLISRLLDGATDSETEEQLSELLRSDPAAVDLWVELLVLHGQLLWGSADAENPPNNQKQIELKTLPQTKTPTSRIPLVSLTCGLLLAVGLVWLVFPTETTTSRSLAESNRREQTVSNNEPSKTIDRSASVDDAPFKPLLLDGLRQNRPDFIVETPTTVPPSTVSSFEPGFTDEAIISTINREITHTLRENEIAPSPATETAVWIRRAWLVFAGRIPAVQEVSSVVLDDNASRLRLIRTLVQSPFRHRRMAEEWTHLLTGRSDRQDIDRTALAAWLQRRFSENSSWMTIVTELIRAEGRSDQNGATNFLLAHLDNQATPATAVAARLFLGEQLQCQQCHDHPFSKAGQQHEYWALNAFFQNTRRQPVPKHLQSPRYIPVMLVDDPQPGMTFFETRNGRQEAVMPGYDGHRIDATQSVARRQELARLLAGDSKHRVARAMVNRVWSNLFGYGFTSTVDDMGSHVEVSHPRLLGLLTEAFTKSGYDLQRLQTWIAASDAWTCSSTATDANQTDDPAGGSVALFSRVYPRRMSPEQMYDSIRTAIHSVSRQDLNAGTDLPHRRQWISQFARPYDTDENDESTDFDGGVSQAMAVMNGPDITSSISLTVQALLESDGDKSSSDILDRICRSVLTRASTSDEQSVFRRHLRQRTAAADRTIAFRSTAEDMMWAWLNSSEFQLVH